MKSLKKNQVIIFVIALMLITAGYLNYDTKDKKEVDVSSSGVWEEQLAEIGDAQLVNSNEVIKEDNHVETDTTNIVKNNTTQNNNLTNNTTNNTSNTATTTSSKATDEYFTSSRLGRDTMYSQMIESYQKVIDNAGISQEQKTVATSEISKINATKNAIMIAENLIKNKEIEDVVIFVNDKSISVILKGENVSQEKIAQVQNIIARELNASIENIHISSK